ncbi:BTB domain-containing protein [Mycena kentingensis (nom. inval.)]|nr:BTB domain-containing protein [Mycena kentingensis (nom. inval.)]
MDVDGPQRSPNLWWDDCGLVIQAENTLYRVSRDQLAAASPIFRDMLLLPAPPDAETYEGCPLVRLPDSAEDITNFFSALWLFQFFGAYPTRTTFAIVSSVLRMGDKYGVDGLRARALTHLNAMHPISLSGWKELPSWEDEPFLLELYERSPSVVALLRKLSLTWMLPVAFYRLCDCTNTATILSADNMSLKDKQRALVAVRLLEGRENATVLRFLAGSYAITGCKDVPYCLKRRMDNYEQALGWGTMQDRDVTGQLPLSIWTKDDWTQLDVCKPWGAWMKDDHAARLSDFWDRLPEIFELPSWEELKELKQNTA